ncbi:MAG: DoxX family protein, partial [Planctomycetota bacterium]
MKQNIHKVLLVLLSLFLVGAGAMHFVSPAFYVRMMPPQLPWPLGIVYLSGVVEIALGLAVLVLPRWRQQVAWAIIALFVAIFPANLYAAVEGIPGAGGYVRLPFQALFIAWA